MYCDQGRRLLTGGDFVRGKREGGKAERLNYREAASSWAGRSGLLGSVAPSVP